jgi:integrase/recombinase XerD
MERAKLLMAIVEMTGCDEALFCYIMKSRYSSFSLGAAMKQAKVLSETELKRVLAVVATMRHAGRNRMALMLSYFGGMRVGEIAALKVGDVMESDGTVKDRIVLRGATTKTGEARAIYVNEKLGKELQRHLDTLTGRAKRLDVALLATQQDGHFLANTLTQLMGQIYKLAGVSGASSHSGRRWFITKLAHSGVSAKVIMTLAGHKNLGTTQRYIDVNDDMMRAAVAIL